MKAQVFGILLTALLAAHTVAGEDLSGFKQNQRIGDFGVTNLFADSTGKIVGAKFLHSSSKAPVYVIQIETAPQAFMWVDAPATTDRGLAHSLEHLLASKGTKGRYVNLLRIMRFSQYGAATYRDYNMYCLTSGTGVPGFLEQFHAFLDALYRPDFSDIEAEREFYHLGVSSDKTNKKRLVEQGTVYNEEQRDRGSFDYYFGLNKQVLGGSNPFAFNIGGDPDEMRDVTPPEIREFHGKHYRLGPGTGFIFVLPPKEDVSSFLNRVSKEFENIPTVPLGMSGNLNQAKAPKYAITPAPSKEIKIYPFPSSSSGDRSEVRMGWAPARANSQEEIRLLELLVRAIGDGDQSLLHKSLVDSKSKELDSEVTSVEAEVVLDNSPWYPSPFINLRGIPGSQVTVAKIETLRRHILAKIQNISAYKEHSPELSAFNQLVMSYVNASERDRKIWIKSSPLFTSEYKTDWKEYLNYLEVDPAFVRRLADDAVWQKVEAHLKSGKNVWRGVIEKFGLADPPYAAASSPSPQLLAEIEEKRRDRLRDKVTEIEKKFGLMDEQEALAQYAQIELRKTAEVDEIEAHVARPRFTDHPPLTPDDDAQYKQFRLENVPVIAVLFEGTPTIDIGLSFDLRRIPRQYYKYLPILPRCFDSLGLKTSKEIVSYADLLAETQKSLSGLSIDFDSNPESGRADLALRVSTASPQELRTALRLIGDMLQASNLDPSNVDRLRDLVNERVADDDRYDKGGEPAWMWHLSDAIRHQDDPLYLALNSRFTQAHWDNRLRWLIHQPVASSEISGLEAFADRVLASAKGLSAKDLSAMLSQLKVDGLDKELVQYWQRNIPAFPERALTVGLRQLTAEVEQDLNVGPDRAMRELKELQTIIVNRNALKVDVTVDPALLGESKLALTSFLQSLQARNVARDEPGLTVDAAPITNKLDRQGGAAGNGFPRFAGFEAPQSATGGLVFSADFAGYSQLDRSSLINVLSSKVASGSGPHTFHLKTFESGLAYANSVSSDLRGKLLVYYADGVPDMASLVEFVNSLAAGIPTLHDPELIEYILQKAFSPPRSMSSFSERGKKLAQDVYDGNEPAKIRRFSEAILKLRNDPNLLSEIIHSGVPAIAPVLLKPEFKDIQRSKRSIFLFVGPERLLADAEARLAISPLLRLYASDLWVDDQNQSASVAAAQEVVPH